VRQALRGFLAIKSLVLSLAILGLWARSYFVGDQFRRGDDAQYVQLGSGRGSVVVTFGHDGNPTRLSGSWSYLAAGEPRQVLNVAQLGDSVWNRVGFGFNKQQVNWPVRGMMVNVVVPHWFMFLLAVPAAARWAMRRWFSPTTPDDVRILECPRCGQMFARVPSHCPICGQALAIPDFH
jgi:hypothetical protein